MKERRIILGMTFICVFIWAIIIRPAIQKPEIKHEGREMSIKFFYVGQGNSALIITPNRKFILIDAGASEGGIVEAETGAGVMISELDAGRDVILPFLKENSIQHIDFTFITHPHPDHYGGLFSIIDEVKLKTLYHTGAHAYLSDYNALITDLMTKGTQVENLSSGDTIALDENVSCTIYHPPEFVFSDTGVSHLSLNDTSLVMKIKYHEFEILFTGDIELIGETILTSTYKDELKADVLCIPHHGSYTSTSEMLLDSVSPEVAIISCGKGNKFGHPHEIVITRLEERNIKVYRTDIDGTIHLKTNGYKYEITTSF